MQGAERLLHRKQHPIGQKLEVGKMEQHSFPQPGWEELARVKELTPSQTGRVMSELRLGGSGELRIAFVFILK